MENLKENELEKAKEVKEENITTLNLRQKLARIRAEFSKSNIKKSGANKYVGFKYFELCDIVPTALELFAKYDVTLDFNMTETHVEGTMYDNSNLDTPPITFAFPKKEFAPLKGMNAIQALGSEITYYRRYLYNIALDIVENDIIDSLDNTDKNKAKTNSNNTKVASNTKVANNPNAPSKDQISELKQSIKVLLDAKPEYEEEMKKIAEQTNRFTNMTSNQCLDLILRVQELIHELPN